MRIRFSGTILVFVLSQYLVKYGLKHAVLFCLIGSCLAHALIYVTIYFVDADTFYTFLAAIPLIISGSVSSFHSLDREKITSPRSLSRVSACVQDWNAPPPGCRSELFQDFFNFGQKTSLQEQERFLIRVRNQ